MIVLPEDREPDSPAHLADRLRGHGVDWPDDDVRTALLRITAALGDDARAAGEAAGMLDQLARRTGTRRVRSITRLLSYVDDQALLAMPEAPARVRTGVVRPSLPDSARAARARMRLDEHALGAVAREEAARCLGPGATPARIDLDALLLIQDPEWCQDERDKRLGRTA